MVDYEDDEEEESEIEELNDSDFADEHGHFVACVVQSLLCNRRPPTLLPKVTITRFDGFDNNKTCVVICANQVQVLKFISGF